ncbi:MAG: rhodanese-like domain-containing protein [Deltaproteobacteria bacterium]|nr:rhodanese-like domain-containing protein [Deltaproteobacteria bacterium]
MRVKFPFALLAGFVLLFLLRVPGFAFNQVLEVDANTLNKWVSEAKDVVLIDVGSPGDFAEGHIPASISIPLGASFEGKIKNLSKGKTYILICPTGRRSAKAASLMIEQGFEKVYNLKGGITDWLRKGLKVAKGTNNVIS